MEHKPVLGDQPVDITHEDRTREECTELAGAESLENQSGTADGATPGHARTSGHEHDHRSSEDPRSGAHGCIKLLMLMNAYPT